MNEFGDGAIEFGRNGAVSTSALPLSFIVAKVLPMMKTPSEAPHMITNSKGCASTSR
jgi:hypothetical protein